MIHLWRLCAVLMVLLLPLVATAKKKSKKKSAMPPEMALSNTLNEKRDDIQACAVNFGLNLGAQRVDVVTKVTINSSGQVVDSRVTVSVQGGDGDQVKGCVDKVVRSIKFPRSDAPLINIERSWSVQAADR